MNGTQRSETQASQDEPSPVEHAPAEHAAAENRAPAPPAARLDRSLEKLGLWRATDIDGRARPGRPASDASRQGDPRGRREREDRAGADPGTGIPPAAGEPGSHARATFTGVDALERLFPDGRWPAADLVELLSDLRGIGELRLLMPVLAELTRQQARWVAWIAPPHIPYAPALAAWGIDIRRVLLIHPRSEREQLWAMEQALRSGTCSAVLGWPGQSLRQQDIRRLQLAATRGNTLGLLFRPEQAALDASPAPFRLVLRSAGTSDHGTSEQGIDGGADIATPSLRVKVLKRRGGWATDFMPVTLPLAAAPAAVMPAPAARAPAPAGRKAAGQAQVPEAPAAHVPTAPMTGSQAFGPAVLEAPPVETLSGLQRHLASWRKAMQRPQPSAPGIFSPSRLVIGRRGVASGNPAGVAKPGAANPACASGGHAPLHQSRRPPPPGMTKPAF